MKLIVGLGNPGLQYRDTRHNAGFMVVDRLADRFAAGETPRARFHGLTVDARIGGAGPEVKCLLVKPTTFMNLSGRCVVDAVRFFKLDPEEDLLVLVDDVALPTGQLRVRARGGAGGHNGLSDIERMLATDAYARCRIGIGSPGRIPQADYVLGKFTDEELADLRPGIDKACDAAVCWAIEGAASAMNTFNVRPAKSAAADEDGDGKNQASQPGPAESGPSTP